MDINLVWDPARGVNFQEYEGDKATATNSAKAAKATGASAAADNDASEKATARHVSDAGFLSYPDEGLSEAERAARKRNDLHIFELCILYLLAFLDRTNIGNAKIAGMNKDLELSDGQYNAALAIFFAIFFSAAALSGSFGGALAAGIQHMDGVGNLRGWSWIFIIEGLLTFVFGIASFWMVHDFPDEAEFLSDEDKQRLLRRLDRDQQASARREVFKTLYFWQAMRDWKTWMSMAIYMGCDMPLFAVTLFLPTIIDDLGLNTSTIQSQLWTVPPYAAAAVFTVFMGWLADKFKVRGICNVCVSMVGIAGFSMILAADSPKIKYIGTCLGVMGLYPCVSNTITWIANNTQGVYKRGVVLGFVIGWGNLSGVLSSFTYRNPPLFIEGHVIVIAFMALCLCAGSLTMMALLSRENRKRVQGKRDCWLDGKTPEEIAELGDNKPCFHYTV
ncbi:hypothetical protein COL940_012608 [Colletotrichum noveboracense]|nr:hypothetical protein COL940_012608 [Colletotrichum noveboracense]